MELNKNFITINHDISLLNRDCSDLNLKQDSNLKIESKIDDLNKQISGLKNETRQVSYLHSVAIGVTLGLVFCVIRYLAS